jgi:hypothetical protein
VLTATTEKILDTMGAGTWPRPSPYGLDSQGTRFATCGTEDRSSDRCNDGSSALISDLVRARPVGLRNGDRSLDVAFPGRSCTRGQIDSIEALPHGECALSQEEL